MNEPTPSAEAGQDATVEMPTTDVQRLRDEAAEAQDRALRAQAELENVVRRSRREIDERLHYANLGLIEDLMPVVDNVARAIEAAEKDQGSAALLSGFKIVAQQLEAALEKHGCRRIAALHQPFDPHLHAALMQQPSSEYPPGTVLQVLQAGFQLHDRVVRPAQVIVSTAPAS